MLQRFFNSEEYYTIMHVTKQTTIFESCPPCLYFTGYRSCLLMHFQLYLDLSPQASEYIKLLDTLH